MLNSWPKLALGRRIATLAGGGVLAGVLVGVIGIAALSGIPLALGGARAPAVAVAAPSPFGFQARAVAEPAPTATADGAALYALHCLACHGPDLKGLPGLGITLAGSGYVARSEAGALAAFLKVGRMPGQPGSVSGRVMPGFAYLQDAELAALADFVKSRGPQP